MVILHGIQSHAGWYRGLGGRLAALGIEAHLPDRRGSGEHTRGRGHAKTSGQLLDDLAGQLRALRAQAPEVPIAVAGISWGAKLALTTAASAPELVDSLIMITPGFHPSVDVSKSAYAAITACFPSCGSPRASGSRWTTPHSSPPTRPGRASSPATRWRCAGGARGCWHRACGSTTARISPGRRSPSQPFSSSREPTGSWITAGPSSPSNGSGRPTAP
jgi:pimeloyl-ACP methyl ester carboxylesterase